MSEQPASAPEPTMEEILASIRRIISEDDAPAAAATADAEEHADAEPPKTEAPPIAAAPPPAPKPVAAAPPHDDVLELTQRVEAFAAEPEPHPEPGPPALGDLDFAHEPTTVAAPPPAPEPTFTRSPEPAAPRPPAPEPAMQQDEPLIVGPAADQAADHFGQLAYSIAMPTAGRTLEDLVREMMRPMLKEWLDQNLSPIVEARVQVEVERISRTRRAY